MIEVIYVAITTTLKLCIMKAKLCFNAPVSIPVCSTWQNTGSYTILVREEKQKKTKHGLFFFLNR